MNAFGVAFALVILYMGSNVGGVSGFMGSPSQEPGSRPPGLVESSMTLNELYRQLLKTQEGLNEVWKQQPGNLPGLKKYTEQLRGQMTTLSESLGKIESTGRLSTADKSTSGKSVIQSPAGPVSPSKKPSPEEDIERRRRATLERFLPGGPQEIPQETPSLVRVPEPWIRQSLTRAMQEVTSLEDILKAQPPDRSTVERSMMKLKTILHKMGNPPPTTPPVTPKDSE